MFKYKNNSNKKRHNKVLTHNFQNQVKKKLLFYFRIENSLENCVFSVCLYYLPLRSMNMNRVLDIL